MKNGKLKRILALLMVFSLCLSMFPTGVFAEETTDESVVVETQETYLEVPKSTGEESVLTEESAAEPESADHAAADGADEETEKETVSESEKTEDTTDEISMEEPEVEEVREEPAVETREPSVFVCFDDDGNGVLESVGVYTAAIRAGETFYLHIQAENPTDAAFTVSVPVLCADTDCVTVGGASTAYSDISGTVSTAFSWNEITESVDAVLPVQTEWDIRIPVVLEEEGDITLNTAAFSVEMNLMTGGLAQVYVTDEDADEEEKLSIAEYYNALMAYLAGGGDSLSASAISLMADAVEGTLQSLINECPEGGTKTITLQQDYVENISIPDGKTIILDLNGHNISPLADSTSLITVYGSLTLTGSGTLTPGSTSNTRAVRVFSAGRFVMAGGTISGFRNNGTGAALRVESNGTFLMSGGTFSNNHSDGNGGAVYIYDGTNCQITGGKFENNTTSTHGGAVHIYELHSGGTFEMKGVEFVGNSAAQYGGAVYIGQNSAASIGNAAFRANSAESAGGAVYIDSNSQSVFNATSFSENKSTASKGGAICIASAKDKTSTVDLNGIVCEGNYAKTAGGAVYTEAYATVNVQGGTYTNNVTDERGGAIAVADNSTAVFNQGTYTGNKAKNGGGIGVYDKSTATFNGVSMSKNTVTAFGGAVHLNSTTTAVFTDGTIISENEAGTKSTSGGCGGGIYQASGTMTVENASITNNFANSGGGIRSGGTVNLKTDAVVDNNYASYNAGGGVYAGTLNISENASVSNNTLKNDYTGSGSYAGGGGVYCTNLNLSGGTISGNSATSGASWLKGGGGVCIVPSGSLNMTGGTISNNVSVAGGAIYTQGNSSGTGTITISGGEICNNTATSGDNLHWAGTGGGGAIFSGYGCKVVVTGGSIHDNRASNYYGGGILVGGYTNKTYDILTVGENALIYNNIAGIKGNDLSALTYQMNGDIYGRPNISVEAPVNGAWYDENKQEEIYVSFDNHADVTALSGDTTTKATWNYTFILSADEVASVGGRVYPSVSEAMADVAAGLTNGDTTVVLLKDTMETVTVPKNLTVSFDLAGHEISGVAGKSILRIPSGSNVTLVDSSEDQSGAMMTVSSGMDNGSGVVQGGAVYVESGASFKMQSGSIRKSKSGIYVAPGASAEITGGSFASNLGNAIYSEGTLTIQGTDSANVEFTGNFKASVLISGEGTATIQNATFSKNSSAHADGGAALTVQSTGKVEISDCTFSSNSGQTYGGAVWIGSTDGNLNARVSIKNSVFDGNTCSHMCSNDGGGAIRISSGSTEIDGCSFTNNKSTSASGGAIRHTGGTLLLKNSSFEKNSAIDGGALISLSNTSTTVNNCSFKENEAVNRGGAIFGGVTLTDTEIIGNKVTGTSTGVVGGGAICVNGDSVISLNHCTITNNTSSMNGGGIVNTGGSSGMILFVGNPSTIYNNCALQGQGDDLYFKRGFDLYPAADMNVTDINCWLDTTNGVEYITAEELTAITNKSLEAMVGLKATKSSTVGTAVARIGTTTYTTLQDAVNAAGSEAVGGDTQIFLLKNLEESVVVAKDKQVGIDLNGFSWTTTRTSSGAYLHSGANLTLTNTNTEADTNPVLDENSGKMIPGADLDVAGGIYCGNATLTIDGVGLSGFHVSGNGGAIYATEKSTVTVRNSTIENCSATSYGGSVYVVSGTATLDNVKIQKSKAATGGAVYTAAGTTLTLDNDTTISECSATTGGAIYANSILNLKKCTIENCTATGSGGAVYKNGGTSTVEQATIKNNTAAFAGGIRFEGGSVTIDGAVFSGNIAVSTTESGGAVYCHSNTSLEVKNSRFENNSSACNGGAFAHNACGAILFENVEFVGNTAKNKSGALHRVWGTNGTTITIRGCLFEGNKSANGGATASDCPQQIVDIYDTVFRNNESTSAGGAITLYKYGYHELHLNSGTVFENNKAANGGAIWDEGIPLTINGDVRFIGNTATVYGGAICIYTGNYDTTSLSVNGATLSGNSASSGGAIYVCGRSDKGKHTIPTEITNTTFTGNSASTGGAISVDSYNPEFILGSGTVITENTATGKGGGVYGSAVDTLIQLTSGGQVYGNKAGLGQDFFENYNASYKSSELRLIPAAEMFPEDDSKTGIGWLDETTLNVYTTSIQGILTRYYALTLDYTEERPVARIGDVQYTSLQAAIQAVVNGDNGDDHTIVLITDVTESVNVPGEFEGVLNLNGYTLSGKGTSAITASGKLEIVDVKEEDGSADTTGTITGSAAVAGGGIHVTAGGDVTLTSGQISGCISGNYEDVSTKGGAVAIESGKFTLAGGSISDNRAYCGAAVNVLNSSGQFVMTGGTISENTSSKGAIYNANNGKVTISCGVLENNTSKYGGAIYGYGSSKTYISGSGEPVILRNNTASEVGGAIYTSGEMIVQNAVITDNTSKTGGAIYQAGGNLTLHENTEIKNNSATGTGGAMYQNAGTVKIIGAVITGNEAQYGGGFAQNPTTSAKAYLMTGKLYHNHSIATEAGNDVYSQNNTTSKSTSEISLIPAELMGVSGINAWKNDKYDGTQRVGVYINDGQYIASNLVSVQNVQLTADYYAELDTQSTFDTNLTLGSLSVMSSKGSAMTTGSKDWDKTSSEEITAAESGLGTPSGQVYTYNGEEYAYLSIDGKLYEQDQMYAWSAGNDSTGSNTLVRSYDTVQYTLTYTAKVMDNGGCICNKGCTEENVNNDCPVCSREDAELNSVCVKNKEYNYHTWIEVILPADMDKASFDVSGMNLKSYTILPKVLDDGTTVQVLSGYREDTCKEGGTSEIPVTIKVYGLANGDTLKPTFKMWVEGDYPETKEAASKTLTVSATPRYNVSIANNSQLAYTSYFDISTGTEVTSVEYEAAKAAGKTNIVYGTILGYGVTVMNYNTPTTKGMKGLELPKDSLNFDLSFKGTLYLDGEAVEGATGVAPYIWAYKENMNTSTGKALGSTSYGVNMNWNDEDEVTKTTQYAYNAAPFNAGGGNNACYSGGSWSMSGSQPSAGTADTNVTVSVTGYSFGTSSSPTQNANGATSAIFGNSAVVPFTAGYVQLLFPIDPENPAVKDASGYLAIAMEAVTDTLNIKSISNQTPEQGEDGKETVDKYYGNMGTTEAKCVNEMNYADNYSIDQTGLYIGKGSGVGDSLSKANWFNGETGYSVLGSKIENGDGTTPLNSTVYIAGQGTFTSNKIATDKEGSFYYISDEDFNPQTDNKTEYNYMTAMNILQKFDAEVFTLEGTSEVVDRRVSGNTVNIGGGAFILTNTESAVSWSSTATKTYDLTILYAAKPDGTNWVKADVSANYDEPEGTFDDGGAADMANYREEDLVYYTTLEELEASGKTCVAVLYEIRNCAVRSGNTISARAKASVTDDFEYTGKTYATTNDVRVWSTYRPLYKGITKTIPFNSTYAERYSELYAPLCEELGKTFSQLTLQDITFQGSRRPDGDPGTMKPSVVRTDDIYKKTQYSEGSMVAGTHSGWMSGNSVLLYTLNTSVTITNTDLVTGSNTKVKDEYNVSKGERVANFRVSPTISVSSAAKVIEEANNGSQATEIEIRLTLPEGLEYREGTLGFDYDTETCKYTEGSLEWEIEVVKNTDGTTSITLKTKVNDISKGLPDVTYATDVTYLDNHLDENRASLATTVEIHSTYEELHQAAAKTNVASRTIIATSTSGNTIYKSVDRTLLEVGDDMGYQLHYSKVDEGAANISVADVLPYNGDRRDTDFTGAYRVKEISIRFTDDVSYQNFIANGSLGYMTGVTRPSTQNEQNALIGKVKSATMLTRTDTDAAARTVTYIVGDDSSLVQDAKSATGIALMAFLPAVQGGDGVSEANGFVISVKLTGRVVNETGSILYENMLQGTDKLTQTGGNKYTNDFLYASGSAAAVPSSSVFVQTINRVISGKVFMDQNQDGAFDSYNDRNIKGVTVQLQQYDSASDSWITAKDILERDVASQLTLTNGEYSFNNLAQGNFRVVFSNAADNYTCSYEQGIIGTETAAHPIAFNKLTVTKQGNVRQRSNGSYSSSGYDTAGHLLEAATTLPASSTATFMLLSAAAEESYIVLPAKNNIRTATYASPNWNLGLIYDEIELTKVWENVLDQIPDGTEVTLAAKGTDPQGDTHTVFEGTYTFKQSGSNVTVSGADAGTTPEVNKVSEGVISWTIKVPVQSENQHGEITYTASETAVLGGFRLRTQKMEEPEKGSFVFTAINRQILYSIDVLKSDKNGSPLSGAEFTVYKDAACTQIVRAATTTADGHAVIDRLTAADGHAVYYVKETKAPSGYLVDNAVYTVTITYETGKQDQAQITVTSDPAKSGFTFSVGTTAYENADGTKTQIPETAEFTVVDDPITVRVHKGLTYQANGLNIENDNVEGVSFRLYKQDGNKKDASGNPIYLYNQTATTGADGFAVFETVPAGTGYTLTETYTLRGLTYVKDARVTVNEDGTIAVSGTETGTDTQGTYVSVKDELALGKITLTKTGDVVQSKTPSTITKLTSYIVRAFEWVTGKLKDVTFDIYAKENIVALNGTVLWEKDTKIGSITTGADGTATMDQLPEGKYYAKEASAPDQYIVDDTPIEIELVLTFKDQDQKQPVVKAYEGTVVNDRRKISVSVLKTADATRGSRPLQGAIFGLYSAKEQSIFQKDELLDVVQTGTDGTAAFEVDLPVGNYYVKELVAPDKYELSSEVYTFTFDAGNTLKDGKAEVSHTFVDPPEKTTVSGQKIWDDEDDENKLRPQTIEITLYANGKAMDGKTITVSADETGNWSWTFTDLEKYDKEDKLITYTFVETELDDYETSYSEDGLTVTNKVVPRNMEVSVEKVWNDASNQDGKRPANVSVQLLKNGSDMGEGYTVELNAGNEWKHTWDGLREKEDGKLIVYSVVEVGAETKDGKTTIDFNGTTYEVTMDSATKEAAENDGVKSVAVTITNSYEPEVLDIPVKKIWTDANNQDGGRPETITVTLLANDDPAIPVKEGETNPVTLDGTATEHGLEYTWHNMPKYADGKVITYSVAETGENSGKAAWITGVEYTVTYSGSTEEGFKITNVHAPHLVDVKVDKVWDDNNNAEEKRPDSVTAQLYCNDVSMGDSYKVVLNEANSWSHTWKNLYERRDGAILSYTVKEAGETDGRITAKDNAVYTVTYEKNGNDYSWKINNIYRPVYEGVKVIKQIKAAEGSVLPELKEGMFTFTLTAVTENAPLPEVTAKVNPAGTADTAEIVFDDVLFNTEGEYIYKITETMNSDAVDTARWSNETGVVYAKITVTETQPGVYSAAVTYTTAQESAAVPETISGTTDADDTIINLYTQPDPTDAEITLIKTISNPGANTPTMDEMEGKFSFSLYELSVDTDGQESLSAALDTKTNTKTEGRTENVIFDKLRYTEVGTFYYVIKEGAMPSASWKAVTGDVYVKVIVINTAENKLQSTVIYGTSYEDVKNKESANAAPEYKNEYVEPDPTEAVLKVEKQISPENAKDVKDYTFTFELQEVISEGVDTEELSSWKQTVTTKTAEPYNVAEFAALKYTTYRDIGTHKYKITEVGDDIPTGDGVIRLNPVPQYVTVEVELTDDNDLSIKSRSDAAKVPVIVNTYVDAEDTDAVLKVKKTVNDPENCVPAYNADLMSKFAFTITQLDETGAEMTAGTNLPEETTVNVTQVGSEYYAVYAPIIYSMAGTYYYRIEETSDPVSDSWTNGEPVYAKVTVTQSVTATETKLSQVTTYGTSFDSITAESASVENVYTKPKPVDASLQVLKLIQSISDGYDAPTTEEFAELFTFVLAKDGEKTTTATNPDGTTADTPLPTVLTAVNKTVTAQDGSKQSVAAFGSMTFEIAGDYYYVITEKEENGYESVDSEVYSNTDAKVHAAVTIRLSTDGSNTLIAEVPVYDEKDTVVNAYEHSLPVETHFEILKLIEDTTTDGSAPTISAMNGKFSFTLTPGVNTSEQDSDGHKVETPMPASDTVTNDNAGKVAFGNVTFTEPGDYFYTIHENEAPDGYWKNGDDVVVKVHVEKGKDNQLTAEVTYGESMELAVMDSATIVNTYGKVNLLVLKWWSDLNDQPKERPDSVSCKLYADDVCLTKDGFELTKRGGWYVTFKNLPKYNPDGSEIVYSVVEKGVKNYSTWYRVDELADGYRIQVINTHKVVTRTGDDNNMLLWAMSGLLSLGGAVELLRRKKKAGASD